VSNNAAADIPHFHTYRRRRRRRRVQQAPAVFSNVCISPVPRVRVIFRLAFSLALGDPPLWLPNCARSEPFFGNNKVLGQQKSSFSVIFFNQCSLELQLLLSSAHPQSAPYSAASAAAAATIRKCKFKRALQSNTLQFAAIINRSTFSTPSLPLLITHSLLPSPPPLRQQP